MNEKQDAIEINILNVGEGDLKITFDPKLSDDLKQAKATITSLLKQGFAIMVEVGKNEKGPLFQRVKRFDPKTCEYIVLGEATSAKAAGKKNSSRQPASTRTYAVARTAGGYNPSLLDRVSRGVNPGLINSKVKL